MSPQFKPAWLILSGVLLRFASVYWGQTFYADEQATLFFSQISSLEALFRDNSAPAFPLLLRAWLLLVPPQEFLLRLLPFGISVVSLGLVWRFWRNPVILILFVINPASVEFAGELKSSALFELTAIIFVHTFGSYCVKWELDSLKGEDVGRLFFSALALGLSHYVGLLLVFSGLIYLTFNPYRNPKHVRRVASIVAICLLAALMFWLNQNWIRAHSLVWMEAFHREKNWLLLTEPLYVLGSYSRFLAIVLVAAIAFRIGRNSRVACWFLLTYLVYVAVELMTNRSLGFRRFLVPLEILSILVLAEAVSRGFLVAHARNWIIVGIATGAILQLKKIGEDIVNPKSGWAAAGAAICSRDRLDKINYFGHESLRYYLPASCASWERSCSEREGVTEEWLVQKQLEVNFIEFVESCSVVSDVKQVATFGADSKEPVLQFKVRTIRRK